MAQNITKKENLSLLIVDDDPMLRNILELFFKLRGFQVQMASNGEMALELFKFTHFDAVITDVRMPIMDGPTLYQHIRSLNKTIPIIFVTGFNQEDLVMQMNDPHCEVHSKPLDNNYLIQRIYKLHQVA